MDRTIVVGDVHGCLDELEDVLRACAWQPGDALVLAGDLVAKGPDSAGVVQLCRERGARAVLGNHDAHVLDVRAGKKPHPKPVHQYVVDTLGQADWRYLEALPLWLRLGPDAAGGPDTVVVHAGVVPGVPIEKQEREHLITLRSIDEDGQPTKRIKGQPWAAVWKGPERVIFGHDAVRGLQQHSHALGLDTGCVYGGRLTAVVLPERRLVAVAARRAYVKLDD